MLKADRSPFMSVSDRLPGGVLVPTVTSGSDVTGWLYSNGAKPAAPDRPTQAYAVIAAPLKPDPTRTAPDNRRPLQDRR